MAENGKPTLETGEIDFKVPHLRDGEFAPPTPKGAPEDLKIRWSAPMPVISDRADLGVNVDPPVPSNPKHRLVAIGDSLTQGFQSLAISQPWLSWPMIVAYEMGLQANYNPDDNVADPEFTFATFSGPDKAPGLPLNLELVLRAVEHTVGEQSLDFKDPVALATVASVARTVAQYWEHGPGSQAPAYQKSYFHNLSVWGFDVRDALSKSPESCKLSMQPPNPGPHPHLEILKWAKSQLRNEFVPSHPNQRTVIRALAGPNENATQIEAAKCLGNDGGIETLIVALGANNVLRVAIDLKLNWTKGTDSKDPEKKRVYNIWTPTHFEEEFRELAKELKKVNAKHVIVATVPHITIIPLMRGIGEKPYYSRYFTRYTRPWFDDANFDASIHPSLTGDEARAVDAAIDQYNYTIKKVVHEARDVDKRDWYLLDMCGLLDRLAYRRYLASPDSRPAWFEPYELPEALKSLSPRPDTRFFGADSKGRTRGGLIALDGIHPTTIGYGILAQEAINIMAKKANVVFKHINGQVRPNVIVDFERLIGLDSLISNPPKLLDESLTRIRAINDLTDLFDIAFGITPVRSRT